MDVTDYGLLRDLKFVGMAWVDCDIEFDRAFSTLTEVSTDTITMLKMAIAINTSTRVTPFSPRTILVMRLAPRSRNRAERVPS